MVHKNELTELLLLALLIEMDVINPEKKLSFKGDLLHEKHTYK